jgi:DNA-binding NarL/FixJ family response regulator
MLGRMRIERLCVPMTDGRVESSTASERGITAVIVERHPFLRMAMRHLFRALEGISVEVESVSAREAIRRVTFVTRTARPTVFILGPSIPIDECVELLASLRARDASHATLAIRVRLNADVAVTLLRHGLHGLLDERTSEEELSDALHRVAVGETVLGRHVRDVMSSGSSTPAAQLSRREIQVLSLLTRGETNQTIARSLGVTSKTVEAHLTRIYSKLDVRSRSQAALLWAQAALNPLPAPAAGHEGMLAARDRPVSTIMRPVSSSGSGSLQVQAS